MSAFGSKLRKAEGGMVLFVCPGCKFAHQVRVDPAFGSAWGFNGSGDAPTFTPSVLVRGGHYVNGETPGNCYCDYSKRYPDKEPISGKCFRCHSFVTDGRIQFLSDCTHALAGQTVDLPDWPT
jgi:hypothetical protein